MKPQWRNTKFRERQQTRITHEIASRDNPYIAAEVRWHGYSVLDLIGELSFSETIFLLLQGRQPSSSERQLFDTLLVACANPGPRHPATRAGITAGASTTEAVTLLPLSLAVMSGSYLSAGEVESAARFIRDNREKDPGAMTFQRTAVDRAAPGFGTVYAGIDIWAEQLADHLAELNPNCPHLEWGRAFAQAIKPHEGWLVPGLFASAALDLGFPPRLAGPLYQLATAPGMLAHATEAAADGITGQPWVDDHNYEINDHHE